MRSTLVEKFPLSLVIIAGEYVALLLLSGLADS